MKNPVQRRVVEHRVTITPARDRSAIDENAPGVAEELRGVEPMERLRDGNKIDRM